MVKDVIKFNPQLVIAEHLGLSVVDLTDKQKLSLYKKSQQSGYSTSILEEVYQRGVMSWERGTNKTPEQYAFDRVNSFISDGLAAEIDEDLRQWFDPNHPKGGWKRLNSKGEAIGACGDKEPGEPKPKCMSNEMRAKLSKSERASAVATKRRHDSDPERKGKPINVSSFGKGKISEMTEFNEENKPTNPSLWSRAKSLARQKFDVYPSAYANGWASKWYKSKGGGWRTANEEVQYDEAANQAQQAAIAIAMKKAGKKPKNEEVMDEDCWDGYKRVGMKKKGGKMVPNCVPEGAEKQSKNKNDPSSRFDATTSLVNIYSKDTPGEKVHESRLDIIKRVVIESQVCADCDCGLAEEVLNERGADAKGYYRSTESGAGLTAKGAKHFGIQTAVTEKNPKGKRAARRRSFCARMGGMKGPMKDEKGRPTRKAMSLRRWRC